MTDGYLPNFTSALTITYAADQTIGREDKPAPPVHLRRVMMFPELLEVTGYSRASIYRLERAGRFPRRVKLGDGYGGKVGFYADEVATWLATRTAEAVASGNALAPASRSDQPTETDASCSPACALARNQGALGEAGDGAAQQS